MIWVPTKSLLLLLLLVAFFALIVVGAEQLFDKQQDVELRKKLVNQLTALDGQLELAKRRPILSFSEALARAKTYQELEEASQIELDDYDAPVLDLNTLGQDEEARISRTPRNELSAFDLVRSNQAAGSPATQPEQQDSLRVRPAMPTLNKRPNESEDPVPRHPHFERLKNHRVLHSRFWKEQLKDGVQRTREGFEAAIGSLPNTMSYAADSITTFLKLDSRGRLLALLADVKEDIAFTRREFASFSIMWSRIMERSLSYLGLKGLNNLSPLDQGEMDFRRDALNALAFGFEYMRLMMAWRENLLIGHQAYKSYLKQIIKQQAREAFRVDELYIYQLEVVHNYILLHSWLNLDIFAVESRMKLEYLSKTNDMRPRNYESVHFRDIVILQELYDPASEEIRAERKQVLEALATASGVSDAEFKDIDSYVEQFRENLEQRLENHHSSAVDWQCPWQLHKFMLEIQDEVRYNNLVYENSFLARLKEAQEKALAEIYRNQRQQQSSSR